MAAASTSANGAAYPGHVRAARSARRPVLLLSNPDPDSDDDRLQNDPSSDSVPHSTFYDGSYNSGPAFLPEPPRTDPSAKDFTRNDSSTTSLDTSGSSSSHNADNSPPPRTPAQSLHPHQFPAEVVADGYDLGQSPESAPLRPPRPRPLEKMGQLPNGNWSEIGYSPQHNAAMNDQEVVVSPTGSNNVSSASPSDQRGYKSVCILASLDSDTHVTVDITTVMNDESLDYPGAAIRELIFSRLRIPDDEHPRYSIYRTELGQEGILGSACADDELFQICSNRTERDIKFLARQDYAYGLLPPAPTYEPPPPPIPSYLAANVAHTSKRSQELSPHSPRSDHLSGSSVSERLGEHKSATGYDASSEGDKDRDRHRTTQPQYIYAPTPNGTKVVRASPDPPSPVKQRQRNASSSDVLKDSRQHSRRPTSPSTSRQFAARPSSPPLLPPPVPSRPFINNKSTFTHPPPPPPLLPPSYPISIQDDGLSLLPPDRLTVSSDETITSPRPLASSWDPIEARRDELLREQMENEKPRRTEPTTRRPATDLDMDAAERARRVSVAKPPRLQADNLLSPTRRGKSERPVTAHAPNSPSTLESEARWPRPQTSSATPQATLVGGIPPSSSRSSNQRDYLPPGAAAPIMKSSVAGSGASRHVLPLRWLRPSVMDSPAQGGTPSIPATSAGSSLHKMKSETALHPRYQKHPSVPPMPTVLSPPDYASPTSPPSSLPRAVAYPPAPTDPTLSRYSGHHSSSRPVVGPAKDMESSAQLSRKRATQSPGQARHPSAPKSYQVDSPPTPRRADHSSSSPIPTSRQSRSRWLDSESDRGTATGALSPVPTSTYLPFPQPSKNNFSNARERRSEDTRIMPVDGRLPFGPSTSSQGLRDVSETSTFIPDARHRDPRPSAKTTASTPGGSAQGRPGREYETNATEATLKPNDYSYMFAMSEPSPIILSEPSAKNSHPNDTTRSSKRAHHDQDSRDFAREEDTDSCSSTDDSSSSEDQPVWSKRPSDNNLPLTRSGSPEKTQQPQLTLQTDLQSTPTIISGSPGPARVEPKSAETPRSPDERTLHPITRPRGKGSFSEQAPWDQMRPKIEDVYDRLDQFFPGHDLDKPVIEVPSGGTSPTVPEQNPQPFNQVDKVIARNKNKKKSIRVVAGEKRNHLYRQSMLETPSSAKLRRRSTKLWDSKVEEVPPGEASTPDSPSAPPPVPQLPSKQIFKWVRGDIIGRGSYGRVYLAMNATNGEMIAVKQVELPKTESDRADNRMQLMVTALKSESDTLKILDHANIVQYLGIEETADYLSIFMEYVSGGSIGACIRKQGRFATNVVKSFTSQILAGLEYLHAQGILHRDLKADNILVDEKGNCKISDFGISKHSADADAYKSDDNATQMQGTIYWMAPEVIRSSDGYSAKVDIWSLGCVWQEMCTGERPWKSENMWQVVILLGKDQRAPPLPEGCVLSEDAQDFRQLCFVIKPQERPNAIELRRHPYLRLPQDWTFTGL